jgi:putative transcriptional regulator
MQRNKLKFYRESNGITQAELAEKLNVTSDYISMIERNERTPGFKLAKAIADLFNTSIDAIFFANEPNETFGNSAA